MRKWQLRMLVQLRKTKVCRIEVGSCNNKSGNRCNSFEYCNNGCRYGCGQCGYFGKNRLKLATIALWKVMKANPLGTILTAAGLATTAYAMLADKIRETETAQDRLNKLQKATVDYMADEKAELEVLLAVAKDETIIKDKRIEAIERLNDISPEYLGNLSLENIQTKEVTDSIEAYTKALEKVLK